MTACTDDKDNPFTQPPDDERRSLLEDSCHRLGVGSGPKIERIDKVDLRGGSSGPLTAHRPVRARTSANQFSASTTVTPAAARPACRGLRNTKPLPSRSTSYDWWNGSTA
jgi:hypothetical protein